MLSATRTVKVKPQGTQPGFWRRLFGRKGPVYREVTYKVQKEGGEPFGTYIYDERHEPGPQMFCANLCMRTGEIVTLDNRG